MNETSSRVKLFFLDNSGQWEDKGIGLASITENTLEILSEDTSEITLNCSIENMTPFRQSDTILCWSDQVFNSYALSFQQIEGANCFWNSFCKVLGLERLEDIYIPEPVPEKIDEIIEIISNDNTIKGITSEWLNELNKNCIRCAEDFNCMKKYFIVYKNLINLGKPEIYEGLLLSDQFLAVFIALEFDNQISFKQNFVAYLEKATFNNFLSITNRVFLDKIHLAHRILCLKESLMSKNFKETTIQALWISQLTLWNDIINSYVNFSDSRAEFILKISETDLNSFLFLNEAISFSKFINPGTRNLFYESLGTDGILKIIQKVWFKEIPEKVKLKSIILDTIFSISLFLPKLIIENFTNPEEKYFIDIFKDSISENIDLIQKCGDILRILIQPQLYPANERFYKDLYDEVLLYYLEKLSLSPENDESVPEILNILSHCLINDNITIRFFFISNSVINRLNSVLKTSSFQIKVSVIKVIKAIIARKDSFLINNMIKADTISILIEIFSSVYDNENLFFSCVLSLLLEIKKIDFKPLNFYVVNVISKYNIQILNLLFTLPEKPLEQLEIKRSRSISFDLSSQESFSELESNYVGFETVNLGKRTAETFAEPTKKIKKNID
jgi:Component of IIS longevity pathway SMK-1